MASRAVLDPDQRVTKPPPERADYEWRGVFEGWAKGYVSRNFWRVRAKFITAEDAVQECAAIFARCLNGYKGPDGQPKLMMAYFKLAVINDFNTFAKQDQRIREIPPPEIHEGLDFNHGPLAVTLARGSDELKAFLRTLETAPSDFLAAMFQDGNDLEALNRRLRRMCGIAKRGVDIIGELRTLLS